MISPVVTSEVQLEAMAPSHRAFLVGGHALEYLVGMTPELWQTGDHRAVHEADARTAAEGMEFEGKHLLEEHAAFKFHEPVIGYRIKKFPTQVYPDIMQVVMFEVGEHAEMGHNQDGHDFTLGKRCLAMPTANAGGGKEFTFGHFRVKSLAELVQRTENIRNYVSDNHRILLFKLLFVRLKVTK